jgi:MFS family permease
MSSSGRYPIWLPAAPAPGIAVFAVLSLVEAIARASLVAVMNIQSYELLVTAQNVSYLSTFVGFVSLAASLVIPIAIRYWSRRWTYTLGALSLLVACGLFYAHLVPTQVAGVTLRSFGTACLNVTANLYLMDYIAKHQLVRADAMRIFAATIGWTLGPYLGVVIAERFGAGTTYAASAGFALLLIGLFWYLRLSDPTTLIPAVKPPENPLRYIPRFFLQPRLRLAWLIAFGRSAFWSAVFVYGPILMVQSGLGREAGGLLVSATNLTLLTALWWGRWAEWQGLRLVTTVCFAGMAALLVAAGVAGTAAPYVAAGLLFLTSIFASGLDAVGGVPFYRAVKPRERPQMTSIYRSYIDLADLLPSVVYGILLGFFDVGSVFVALGIGLVAIAWASWRYLPRSL